MKRNEYITPKPNTQAWRASEIESAVPTRCLYVRVDSGVTTIKFVGCYAVPPGADFNVTIRIWDNRSQTHVLRLAYANDGITPVLSSAAMILTIPSFQLP